MIVLLPGCPSLPDVAWEGEHVTFGADHPEQLCGGTRHYLDQRAGETLASLNSSPIQIEYYWLDNVADHCPESPSIIGCGAEGLVFSEWVPHMHEIVHARAGDRLPVVLEEGFAFHFGDPYPVYEMASRERLTELLMGDLGEISGVADYARVAHFLAFLSESHGREQLLLLDAALGRDSSPAQVEAALEAIFGLGRERLLTAYADYPECHGNVDTSVVCAANPVARLGEQRAVFERRIDCAAADVMGPYEGMAYTEDIIEIAPSTEGRYLVHATGDGIAKGGNMLLRRCGPCSEGGVYNRIGDDPVNLSQAQLPTGRYLVQFHVPVDAGPVDFGVHVSVGG
ncbi:hypothetical protein [Enhygromyxa salina]|nr:hypothetical protein [Enhygromyxa salina]